MVQSWGVRIGLFGLSMTILGTPMGIPFEVKAEDQTTSIQEENATTEPAAPATETPQDSSSPKLDKQPPVDSEEKAEDPKTVTPTVDTHKSGAKDTPKETALPEETAPPPSPKKLALIQRLLLITEQKKNAEQRLEVMLANMEETLPKVLANMIRDRTQLQGDELVKRVTTTAQRMVKRYRELLPSRVNIGEITEEISTNLYAKYYTEKELKDLIKFYQTPTGRKAIATLPQLTKEALAQSNDILLPEITQLLQEIMQEEFGPESPQSSPEDEKVAPKP
ncbi:DUF2059 domain-containing protein [Acaryochloris sp. CCMEE 5410]|uniref:DUF2059 domain-containing protein n=1 Tax=Acaryochloris sp. CCMEE 5410 TaxID=310037 RepID=UPI0002484982|nr:DUF2059 domain-containing protein [Acaryochloris sp. CCMEE 5410]KAI9130745.1 DUF2059 domain-containing protein [Acaryochloris sp. CCMEE 5410]